jgi:tetratricopeptide (TPR) repeat protein
MKFSKAIFILLLFISGCNSHIFLNEKVNKEGSEFINKAKDLINDEKYEEAITALDSSIMYDPKYCYTHFLKGLALLRMKKFNEALNTYDNYLKNHSSSYVGYYNRAIIKEALGDTLEAIKDYKKTLRINKKYIEAYEQIGYIKVEKRDYSGALKYYNKAIKICTSCNCYSCCYAYDNKGYIFLIKGDTSTAESLFEKSTYLNKYNYYPFFHLASLKLSQGNKEVALNIFTNALSELKKEGKKAEKNYNYFCIYWGKYLSENNYCNEALPYLKYSLEHNSYNDCFTESELRAHIKKCESE